MTDTELTQHRKATKFGRKIGLVLMVGAVSMMFIALGILFHQQEAYQKCVANFQDSESQARIARTAASAENTKALTSAFVAAAAFIDPSNTPTMQQQSDLRKALIEVPAAQERYDLAIDKYPYQKFDRVCPS